MAKIKQMKTVEKIKTVEELTIDRDNLLTEVEAIQKKLAEEKYPMDFDNVSNITKVLKHLDKNTKWTIKDCALAINLYDNIKLEKSRISGSEDKKIIVNLAAVDLNTLYKSLTECEGYGVENAKGFLRILTNLGSQISMAMESMQNANKDVQKMHVTLGEMDSSIEAMSIEKVEADEIIE